MSANAFVPVSQLTRQYFADAIIPFGTIVKFDSADDKVAAASAATDAVLGVVSTANAATFSQVDVAYGGEALVIAGGSITRGQPVVSDGSGHAVAITPGNTTANRILGYAHESGESGQFITVLVMPSVVLV